MFKEMYVHRDKRNVVIHQYIPEYYHFSSHPLRVPYLSNAHGDISP